VVSRFVIQFYWAYVWILPVKYKKETDLQTCRGKQEPLREPDVKANTASKGYPTSKITVPLDLQGFMMKPHQAINLFPLKTLQISKAHQSWSFFAFTFIWR